MTRDELIRQEAAKERSMSQEKAFRRGADFAANHCWVSVEDELPPLDTDVLCVDKRGEHTISRRVKSSQQENGFGWCAHYGYTNGPVTLWTYPTHWMPLPEPPANERRKP